MGSRTVSRLWRVSTLLGLLSMAPSMRLVDLRSDTVTRPSALMRQAMSEALVGDDVFGDDPTVSAFEMRAAALFEKESGLFFPSGTMANLAATMSWCGSRGAEMLLGSESHMFLYEQGGAAQIAGVQTRPVSNKRDGTMKIDALEKCLRSDNIHFPTTELVCLENTHNHCGGRVLPEGYTEAVAFLTQKRGIPLHLDGARIWNAATATGQSVAQLTRHADSVTACLSKGLGAPVGSVLVGSSKFIAKARRVRKVLGGGMRQTGILAAAALVALDDFSAGVLESSHSQAKVLAKALSELPGFGIDVEAVETNIVLVHLDDDSPAQPVRVVELLRDEGVLALAFGHKSIRLVTHRDLSEEDVAHAIEAFKRVSRGMWPRPQVPPALVPAAAAAPAPAAAAAAEILTPPPVVAAATAEALILAVSPTAEERGISVADGPVTGNEVRDAPKAPGPDVTRTVSVAEPTLPANLAAAANAKALLSSSLSSPSSSSSSLSAAAAVGVASGVSGVGMMEILSDQAGLREAWGRQAERSPLLAPNAYAEFASSLPSPPGFGEDPTPSSSAPGAVVAQSGAGAGAVAVVQDGVQEFGVGQDEQVFFEEAVVHGMSVSPDGFCVLLRGVVCDRVVTVLVTPSDPMADGLDRDQVETPEAVTLLQLLQGIDVESHLGHNALRALFSKTMDTESSMQQKQAEAESGLATNSTTSTAKAASSFSSASGDWDLGAGAVSSLSFSKAAADKAKEQEAPLMPALSLPNLLIAAVQGKASSSSSSASSSSSSAGLEARERGKERKILSMAPSAALNETSAAAMDALRASQAAQEMVLRRVMVSSMSTPKHKDFSARLCGCIRRHPEAEPPQQSDLALAQGLGLGIATVEDEECGEQAGAELGMLFSPISSLSPQRPSAVLQSPFPSAPTPVPALAPALAPALSPLALVQEKICAVVEVQSAFQAIALALRHSAVVEVKSSLFLDPELSCTVEELKARFPKLLEADRSADARQFSEDYDTRNEMERLQRQLIEALRQGNAAKVSTIKRQLEYYSNTVGTSVLLPAPPTNVKAQFADEQSAPRFDF